MTLRWETDVRAGFRPGWAAGFAECALRARVRFGRRAEPMTSYLVVRGCAVAVRGCANSLGRRFGSQGLSGELSRVEFQRRRTDGIRDGIAMLDLGFVLSEQQVTSPVNTIARSGSLTLRLSASL